MVTNSKSGDLSASGMKSKKKDRFDAKLFLASVGASRKAVEFSKKQAIFSQGEAANAVMYVQQGNVKLTVVNEAGKEAVVAIFGRGDFFGEGVMAGQQIRMGTATAISATTVLMIEKDEMARVLHAEHELSDRFISYMVGRNIRVEADLVDQLFNSTEKRLARTLLLLARYGRRRPAGAGASKGISRDAGGNDWHNSLSGEYVHEQVQELRLHRVQRRNQNQQVSSHRCPARVKASDSGTCLNTALWMCAEQDSSPRQPPAKKYCGDVLCPKNRPEVSRSLCPETVNRIMKQTRHASSAGSQV